MLGCGSALERVSAFACSGLSVNNMLELERVE
jgi:hypothetical protein